MGSAGSKKGEKPFISMMYKIQNGLVGITKEQYIKISPAAGIRRNHTQHIEIPFASNDVFKNSEQAEHGMGLGNI